MLGFGATRLLKESVGSSNAKEIILSGQYIYAKDAVSIGKNYLKLKISYIMKKGLVSKVFSTNEDLMNSSISLAKRIARNKINALIKSKELMCSSKFFH